MSNLGHSNLKYLKCYSIKNKIAAPIHSRIFNNKMQGIVKISGARKVEKKNIRDEIESDNIGKAM